MVINKLKELGLIFKAPTKKSNALPKNAWLFDQDQRLRDLYDENRLHDGKYIISIAMFWLRHTPQLIRLIFFSFCLIDCLSRIQGLFEGRSKNAIVKRMIALGLIADRSEILPKKVKKSNKNTKSKARNGDSDTESNDDSSDDRTDRITAKRQKNSSKPKKAKIPSKRSAVRVPFKLDHLKSLLSELDDKLKSVLPWLQESLSDAAEDMEETPSDEDNGIPLVPFTIDQSNAMDDENFKFFLTALGIQPPIEQMVSMLISKVTNWYANHNPFIFPGNVLANSGSF